MSVEPVENARLNALLLELEKKNLRLEKKLKRAQADAENWGHYYDIANPHVALAHCALLAHGARRNNAPSAWNDACDHIEGLIHRVELSTLRDLKEAGAPFDEKDWPSS